MLRSTEQAIEVAGKIGRASRKDWEEWPQEIEEAEFRVAILHTRQDVASLFVMTGAIHSQLIWIRRGVWLFGVIACAALSFIASRLL